MNSSIFGGVVVALTSSVTTAFTLIVAFLLHRPAEVAHIKVDEAALIAAQLDILKKGNEELIRQNADAELRNTIQAAQMVELREDVLHVSKQLTASDAERTALRKEVSELKSQIAKMAIQLSEQSTIIVSLSKQLGTSVDDNGGLA